MEAVCRCLSLDLCFGIVADILFFWLLLVVGAVLSMLCFILLLPKMTVHTELAAVGDLPRASGVRDEHAPIIKSISIEPLAESRGGGTFADADIRQHVGQALGLGQCADRASRTETAPLRSPLETQKTEPDALLPAQTRASQAQQCYVASYKSSPAGECFLDFLSGLGAKVLRKYSRYFNGVHFCLENTALVRKVREHHLLACMEKDSVYAAAHSQSNVPRHMRLMQYYGNLVFNNHLYDNVLLRYFPPMFLYRMLFNYYRYDFAGAGVDIYLVDTTVDTSAPEIRGRAYNLYPHAPVCNMHGTNMAVLAAGATMGFAKRSNVHAVNVLDCDGRIHLSRLLSCLEQLQIRRDRRSILLFSMSGPRSEILNRVVSEIALDNTVVVTAAGNNGESACKFSPGSSRAAINVGATNKHARPSSFTNHGDCVSIFSLGEEVGHKSVVPDAHKLYGTSVSAALVAGAAAVFLEKFHKATPTQVWLFLLKNSFRTSGSLVVQKIPHLDLYSGTADLYGPHPDVLFYCENYMLAVVECLLCLLLVAAVIYYLQRKVRERRRREMLMAPPIDRKASACSDESSYL